MKRIIFYLPDKCMNEATSYYVDLIRNGFIKKKIDVVTYNKTNFSFDRKNDYVFTIRIRDFMTIFVKYFTFRILNWFQGIGPEEYLMINNYTLKAKVVSRMFSFMEFLTIRISYFNFFVSDAMKVHYEKKYFKNISNYMVIPCYNKKIVKEYFDKSKKKELSFVYAGTLYGWQCFEKTVKLFREIEKINPNASFTILTKEEDVAKKVLVEYGVENYSINYVSLSELDEELSKYQFGFLLRDENPINFVSTPTKMNSYLAAALIPIYTNAIDSFNKDLKLDKYGFCFSPDESFEIISNKINGFDIDYSEMYDIYEKVFDRYYNDDIYIKRLNEKILIK